MLNVEHHEEEDTCHIVEVSAPLHLKTLSHIVINFLVLARARFPHQTPLLLMLLLLLLLLLLPFADLISYAGVVSSTVVRSRS